MAVIFPRYTPGAVNVFGVALRAEKGEARAERTYLAVIFPRTDLGQLLIM